MVQGFPVDAFQVVCGGVGVGVGLEIGDVAGGRTFGFQGADACLDLVGDGEGGITGKFAGAAGAAEDAAPGSQGSVPVGAGAADIQGELVELFAEAGLYGFVEGIVGSHSFNLA